MPITKSVSAARGRRERWRAQFTSRWNDVLAAWEYRPVRRGLLGSALLVPGVAAALQVSAAVGAFMLGTSWVLHLGEARRWLWLAGLILLIMTLGIVTDGEAKFAYFAPFPTTAAALLIRWREARLVIVLISLAAGGWSLARGDIFGVVLAIMAATIGSTVGLTLQAEHARRRAEVAEQRTERQVVRARHTERAGGIGPHTDQVA